MRGFSILIIFSAAIAVSFSSVFQIASDPDHPGKCIFKGQELKLGINLVPNTCGEIKCREDGSMSGYGCMYFEVENCERGKFVDESKPYPECCKRYYNCKDNDGVENIIEM